MDTVDKERSNIQQSSNDNSGQVLQTGAAVYGGIKQTQVINGDATKLAQYENKTIRHGSISKLKKRSIISSILTAISCIIGVFKDVATILHTLLQFIEIHIPSQDIQNASIFVMCILAGYSFIQLSLYGDLIKKRWHRGFLTHARYDNKEGDEIIVSRTIADCPDETCSGKLYLKNAKHNKQGVGLVGTCTQQPGLHVYSFDENTMRGRLINLDYIDGNKEK